MLTTKSSSQNEATSSNVPSPATYALNTSQASPGPGPNFVFLGGYPQTAIFHIPHIPYIPYIPHIPYIYIPHIPYIPGPLPADPGPLPGPPNFRVFLFYGGLGATPKSSARIGEHDLQHILSERLRINTRCKDIVEHQVMKWGVAVDSLREFVLHRAQHMLIGVRAL